MWCRSRWRPHPHPTLEPAYSGAHRNPINMCSVHANRFNSSRTARYIRPRVFCLFLSINSGNEIRDDNPCFLKGVSMDSDIATRILFHSTGKKRFFGTPVYYWFQIKKEKKKRHLYNVRYSIKIINEICQVTQVTCFHWHDIGWLGIK